MKKVICVFFTLIIILLTSITAFAKNDSKSISARDFDRKKIAVETGTDFENIVYDVFRNPQKKQYDSLTQAITPLKTGKIDAIVGDEANIKYISSQVDEIDYFVDENCADEIAIISGKNAHSQMLVEKFDYYFQNHTQEVNSLKEKWFSCEDKKMVMEDYTNIPNVNGEIIIATSAEFAPFDFITNGQVVGYEIELLVNFCKYYGYKPNVVIADNTSIINGVLSGKYDFGASGYSINSNRKNNVLFTDCIHNSIAGVAYVKKNTTFIFSNIFTRFKRTFFEGNRYKMFIDGINVTLKISLVSVLVGFIVGFAFYFFYRKSSERFKKIIKKINGILTGLPTVVILMVLFYIIFRTSDLSGSFIAIIAFSNIFAFRTLSMFENAENMLDKGQILASKSLGYSVNKSFFKIVCPQISMYILSQMKDELIAHIKETAVVGYVAVVDIAKVGSQIGGLTYDSIIPVLSVAVIYFILSGIINLILSFIIKKLDPKNRSEKKILKGAVIK